MDKENKNKLLEEYIRSLIDEVNEEYPGLLNSDKEREFYESFRDSDKDFKEEIVPELNELAEQIMQDYEELLINLKTVMRLREEQEIEQMRNIEMPIDQQAMFLGSQNLNLLAISQLESKEGIKEYIANACSQFPTVDTQGIIDNYERIINDELIDEVKDSLAEKYQQNLANHYGSAVNMTPDDARKKLANIGIEGEELERSVTKISKGQTVEVLGELVNKHGEGVITTLNQEPQQLEEKEEVQEVQEKEPEKSAGQKFGEAAVVGGIIGGAIAGARVEKSAFDKELMPTFEYGGPQQVLSEEPVLEQNQQVLDPQVLQHQQAKRLVRRPGMPGSSGFGHIAVLVALVSFGIGVISTITYLIVSTLK